MTLNKKSFMAIAFTASTALALTACGDSTDTQPATATAEATDQAASSAVESAEATAAEDTPAAEEAATGEDPVFAALDAVMAQHTDAVIVNVDREDDTEVYDVDAVIGTDVVEFKVNSATGEVTEEEREANEDEVNLIANVTVAAHDAIQQALDQHPGAVLDEADLEEENNVIEWQIELDDADRNDLAEVKIQAN